MKYNANPPPTMKLQLALLLAVFAPLAAQAANPVAPDAGSILQQVRPVAPPSPSPTGTGLTIEREGGAKLPPSAAFEVKTIQVSGNTLFDTATLHALVADAEGKTLTLAQLDELAARITAYYQERGYPLARAFIPAQTIRDGAVRIEIIEARYGKIILENQSRVKDPLLQDTLSPLQSGQAVGQAALDHSLLLLSDIPGIAVNATLKPGEAVGTSDLLVETAPGPAISGNVVLDNYGNRYTGRARIGGTVNFFNPLHHGDVLNVNALTSGSGMRYGRVAYDSLLNGRGTRMGGSYSALHYALGGTLVSLNGHGTAQVGNLWAKHPLVRERDVNLNGQIEFASKQLRDHIDASATHTDRHLDNWSVSLAGDARDAFLSGGVNTWSASWASGRVGFDNAAAQLADAGSARTGGDFSKWNASFSRLQSLSLKNTLYLTFAGQGASGNLDSSEKMTTGGPYTVRAYDMGAVSGDTGYQATAEFRRDLGQASYGQWQAVAFIDSAHVEVNRNTWVAGTNSATLSGAGVGLVWAGSDQWSAKAYIAAKAGQTPSLVASAASARAWVEIGKGF